METPNTNSGKMSGFLLHLPLTYKLCCMTGLFGCKQKWKQSWNASTATSLWILKLSYLYFFPRKNGKIENTAFNRNCVPPPTSCCLFHSNNKGLKERMGNRTAKNSSMEFGKLLHDCPKLPWSSFRSGN